MPWIRLDDNFDEHPKMIQVGPVGMALFVAGLAYCNRNLTDGFIPERRLRALLQWDDESLARRSTPVQIANRLVSAGLWERVEGGYKVHDYLDYQPSRASVRAERERVAQRVKRWREGSSERESSSCNAHVTPLHDRYMPVTTPLQDSECNADVTALHIQTCNAHVTVPPTRPDPTQPDPIPPLYPPLEGGSGAAQPKNRSTKNSNAENSSDETNDSKPKRRTTVAMKPPTLEEVTEFFKSKGVSDYKTEAEQFYYYYTGVGWTVGKNKPMIDWKAAVANWILRNKQRNADNSQTQLLDLLRRNQERNGGSSREKPVT